MTEDEAGFIAMHLVNAQLNEEISNISRIPQLVHDVLNIVKYHFKIDFDEDALLFSLCHPFKILR